MPHTYFHSVNSGDLVASLPGMRQIYRKTGNKAIVYQQINKRGRYYPGATHPVRHDDDPNVLVTMNQKMFDMIRPLIISQEYVEDLLVWKGEKFDTNLNRIHEGVNVNMPWGSINRWTWYCYFDMACNLAEKWLTVPRNDGLNVSGINNSHPRILEDCLIVNFSERYRNEAINYYFLKHFQHRIIFAGTYGEYEIFKNKWELDIPYLNVNNFMELAQAINQCKAFLGNASMCWNIAEALKVPRVLELSWTAQNCIPVGDFAYDFWYEGAAEGYINDLMGKDASRLNCPVCDHVNSTTESKGGVDYFKCSECHTIYSTALAQEGMLGGEAPEERSELNHKRIARFKDWGVTTLLDFGCGEGYLVKDASSSGIQVFGYDKYSKDPRFHNLPTGLVDCVSMIEVIEHLPYPFQELKIIHDQLQPGGIVYVETSFSDFLNMTDDYIDPRKGHCTIFSYQSMDILMLRNGFELRGVVNRNIRIYRKGEGDQ